MLNSLSIKIASTAFEQLFLLLRNFIDIIINRNIIKQSEAVVRRCSVKKVLLEISQNSQENTCARVFFHYINITFVSIVCFPKILFSVLIHDLLILFY